MTEKAREFLKRFKQKRITCKLYAIRGHWYIPITVSTEYPGVICDGTIVDTGLKSKGFTHTGYIADWEFNYDWYECDENCKPLPTQEGMMRFKTHSEFVTEFGLSWRNQLGAYWSKSMDPLFGTQYIGSFIGTNWDYCSAPEYMHTKHGDFNITRSMLTNAELPKNEIEIGDVIEGRGAETGHLHKGPVIRLDPQFPRREPVYIIKTPDDEKAVTRSSSKLVRKAKEPVCDLKTYEFSKDQVVTLTKDYAGMYKPGDIGRIITIGPDIVSVCVMSRPDRRHAAWEKKSIRPSTSHEISQNYIKAQKREKTASRKFKVGQTVKLASLNSNIIHYTIDRIGDMGKIINLDPPFVDVKRLCDGKQALWDKRNVVKITEKIRYAGSIIEETIWEKPKEDTMNFAICNNISDIIDKAGKGLFSNQKKLEEQLNFNQELINTRINKEFWADGKLPSAERVLEINKEIEDKRKAAQKEAKKNK